MHVLLTVHHIVVDGWSIEVFWRELAALYDAHPTRTRAAALPPLPVQYADFAAWQRQWLQGEVLEAQLELLAAAPGRRARALDLPTDLPAAGRCRPSAAPRCLVALSPGADGGLQALSRRGGRHAVHDAAGGVHGAARHATAARTTWRSALPWPAAPAPEIGGADRVLRQHAGAAHRPR